MTLLVQPERRSHWYDKTALPVFKVPYKDPKRMGEMRPVDLRDARKLDLLPSVTNVLSVMDRPGIRAWQATQYILAALTLPRNDGESLDDFAARVVEDGEQYRNDAADQGVRLHELIAGWMAGRSLWWGVFTLHMEAFAEWWVGRSPYSGGRAEAMFATVEHGFAGCADYVGVHKASGDVAVIDWKSQETKPGKPVTFYDEWPIQLAGYAIGLHEPESTRLVNVVVSRNEPGRIEVKEWDDAERWRGCFMAALCLWKLRRGYYP